MQKLLQLINQVKALWSYLSGKKTHIVATALALLNVANALSLISPHDLAQINMILLALGLSALRSGANKSTPLPPV